MIPLEIERRAAAILDNHIECVDEYAKYQTTANRVHKYNSEKEVLKLIKLWLLTMYGQELIYGEDYLLDKE